MEILRVSDGWDIVGACDVVLHFDHEPMQTEIDEAVVKYTELLDLPAEGEEWLQ